MGLMGGHEKWIEDGSNEGVEEGYTSWSEQKAYFYLKLNLTKL